MLLFLRIPVTTTQVQNDTRCRSDCFSTGHSQASRAVKVTARTTHLLTQGPVPSVKSSMSGRGPALPGIGCEVNHLLYPVLWQEPATGMGPQRARTKPKGVTDQLPRLDYPHGSRGNPPQAAAKVSWLVNTSLGVNDALAVTLTAQEAWLGPLAVAHRKTVRTTQCVVLDLCRCDWYPTDPITVVLAYYLNSSKLCVL